MWLFTSDAEINCHQIVPITYNMNWVQANVGHRADVCISVVTTANLAEDSPLYLTIFREQETCDAVIHCRCWFLVMSNPAFYIRGTSAETSEVRAEKVTDTASVICLDGRWSLAYVSQRNEVSCPAWHSCHLAKEPSGADSTSAIVIAAHDRCVKGCPGAGVRDKKKMNLVSQQRSSLLF